MKQLLKRQIEYATNRINLWLDRQKKAHRDLCTTGKKLTPKDKARLIKSGKVAMRQTVTEIGAYDRINDAFDFSAYDQQFDKTRFEKLVASDAEKAQKMLDELNLGDSEAALKMIEGLVKRTE